MAAERLSMRKIRELLRLQAAGHSQRAIARSLGVARSTVGDYLGRIQQARLTWPVPPERCVAVEAGTGMVLPAQQQTVHVVPGQAVPGSCLYTV